MPNRKSKIAFVGGVFLDENQEYIMNNSIQAIQNAADILQKNYISGIESNTNQKVSILNCTFVGTYPKSFKRLRFKGAGYVNRIRRIYDCSFVNIPVIVSFSKLRSLVKAYNNVYVYDKPDVVIAYGFFKENIIFLAKIKLLHKDIKTCLIIPDLPEYMSGNNNMPFLRKVFINRTYSVYSHNKKYIDYYSVITPQMADRLKLKKTEYVVIDGMIGNNYDKSFGTSEFVSEKFIFMYSGGLSKSYGTEQLLRSFSSIENPNVELWICGDGPFKNDVIKAQKNDTRIRYFGVIGQEECHSLQRKASCLINPRDDSEITQYSFPSKTMEYLASGVPVIAKKLEGMDSEYSKYFLEFNNGRSLEETMKTAITMSDKQLKQYGIRGKDFVREFKSCGKQTKKLLDLMGVVYK